MHEKSWTNFEYRIDLPGDDIMNNYLTELKNALDNFFNTATDESIRDALAKADYEYYTGVKPESLVLTKPFSGFTCLNNIPFSYAENVVFNETDYVYCFDCYTEIDNSDTSYLKAA